VDRPGELAAEVIRLLSAGGVVGWFEGGSELGPRPLGNRSLLADARLPRLGERLNRQQHLGPPAAVVTAEGCADLFEVADISPHHPLPARVRAGSLPAVTREDGLAVVQCVTNTSHPRLHALLTAWAETAGAPVLAHAPLGEPLVETPEEALGFARSAAVDALVLEHHLIRKRSRRD
jgi:carbamoyltransferase